VKLAALLRLAAAFDRGRGQLVDGLDVELSGGRLRLQARTAGNCELEVWAALRQAPLLERVFGRRVEVDTRPPDTVAASAKELWSA
jgi:hypothetical protein